MPVTFQVARHDAKPVRASLTPVRDAMSILQATWGEHAKKTKCVELLQGTFSQPAVQADLPSITPLQNGFVNTLTTAYNYHHHLTIRPDDVWIAILSQFSFYVNAHSEELRSHFVAHEGKKELTVSADGNRYSVDFGSLTIQMTEEIHKNVVDPDLKDWILPNFTTTTQNDTITSAVVMMATLKEYFDFRFMLMCGIPSVTLEGEKHDWQNLLARIDKFATFGNEPTEWVTLLRPILTRFVNAFDGEPDIDFWGRVCHYSGGGSGPTYLCGWVTAFCVWNADGKWKGQKESRYGAKVDGVTYPTIDTDLIPQAFAEVDVKLDDNGTEIPCRLVAGHVATETVGEKRDGVRPRPGWFFFERQDL